MLLHYVFKHNDTLSVCQHNDSPSVATTLRIVKIIVILFLILLNITNITIFIIIMFNLIIIMF